MNGFELKKLKGELEQGENNILFTKGTEYALSQDDRLAFFREYSSKLGIDAKMVCAIFLMKHVNSILNYVKTGKSGAEDIKGRIMDARNYLLFMEALIDEEADWSKVGGTCGTWDDNPDAYQFGDYTIPVTTNVTAACMCETPKDYEIRNDGTVLHAKTNSDYYQNFHKELQNDLKAILKDPQTTTEDEVRSQEWEDNCRWELNADEPVHEDSELVGDGDN